MCLSSKHSRRTGRQGRSGQWQASRRRNLLVAAALSYALALFHPVWAAEFACPAGDVACLIEAIHTANANGGANTITLEAGTYTLTTVDNLTEGANGLPSITSPLTIRGAGAGRTILEREPQAPAFRLVHVAATGTLTLEGLTLEGETESPGGGLLHIGGTVILTHSRLADTRASINGGGTPQDVMPPPRPRITETDLMPPPSPQQLEAYLTLVQRTLKHETAAIPQTGLVEVTLAIRRDGSVAQAEIVQLDGPATLRTQLLPIVKRLGLWPPPPVEVEVLVVTVLLTSQYPGADLLDRFGPQR